LRQCQDHARSVTDTGRGGNGEWGIEVDFHSTVVPNGRG
jgi:hypothetical protein